MTTVPAKYAYVGCNTVKDPTVRKGGNGDGISVYRIIPASRDWELVQVCEALPNPGFQVMNSRGTFLYSSHGDYNEVSAFSIDADSGKLTFINKQPTDGHNSRHIAIDPTDRYIVLNKGKGVTVHPINADGSLAPFTENLVPFVGPQYAHRKENFPCPHQIVFDPSGRYTVMPDRNLDKVHVYKLDTNTGKLIENDLPPTMSKDESGPRHIAFHPTQPFAYVINETDSTVTAYRWDDRRGELKTLQNLPSLPATFNGKNLGSEIAVGSSGKHVYASNRGHDSIAIYAINSDGTLTSVGWQSSQGKTPRFFAIDPDGSLMYVANQDSDTIMFFRIDSDSGTLTPTGRVVKTGTPTCITFR